eukprot:6195227-Pleurochrysis_carterae.AAC.1
MQPTSLDSKASHAAFAYLTLLRQRRHCAAAPLGPCRSCAPRVLDSAPSLAPESRCAACKVKSSLPRATNNTKKEFNIWRMSSPQPDKDCNF